MAAFHAQIRGAVQQQHGAIRGRGVVDGVVGEPIEAVLNAAPEHQQVRPPARRAIPSRRNARLDRRQQPIERTLQHHRVNIRTADRQGTQHGGRPHRLAEHDEPSAWPALPREVHGARYVVGFVIADRRVLAAGTAAAGKIDEQTGVAEFVKRPRFGKQVGLAARVAVEKQHERAVAGVRDVPRLQRATTAREGERLVVEVELGGCVVAHRPRHQDAAKHRLDFAEHRQRFRPGRAAAAAGEARHGPRMSIGQHIEQDEAEEQRPEQIDGRCHDVSNRMRGVGKGQPLRSVSVFIGGTAGQDLTEGRVPCHG